MPVVRETRNVKPSGDEVHIDLAVNGRRRLWNQKRNEIHTPHGKEKTEAATKKRLDQALHEQLAHDPIPTCAERRADGNLLGSGGRPGEKKMSGIGTSDEEDQSDGGEKKQKRRAHVLHVETLKGIDSNGLSGVGVWVVVGQPLGNAAPFRSEPAPKTLPVSVGPSLSMAG